MSRDLGPAQPLQLAVAPTGAAVFADASGRLHYLDLPSGRHAAPCPIVRVVKRTKRLVDCLPRARDGVSATRLSFNAAGTAVLVSCDRWASVVQLEDPNSVGTISDHFTSGECGSV